MRVNAVSTFNSYGSFKSKSKEERIEEHQRKLEKMDYIDKQKPIQNLNELSTLALTGALFAIVASMDFSKKLRAPEIIGLGCMALAFLLDIVAGVKRYQLSKQYDREKRNATLSADQ